MHRIEHVRAVTSVMYHPDSSVLDTKTKFVKFNNDSILTSKATNRNEISDYVRRHKNITHMDGSKSRGKRHMTDMCNG